MSISGLFAAKKRIETSIKKYELPTEDKPVVTNSCENGVLLLSLLQSRLNWTSNVFPKYKSDSIQQPKRTNTTRRKWPHMKYLGTCTLELGAHIFEETSFYEATREESWSTIAKSVAVDLTSENEEALAEAKLVYYDVVFELNEASSERFLFPKEAIIETLPVDQQSFTIHASFALPLDHTTTEAFFDTPKVKLMKYGKTCQLDAIKNYVDSKEGNDMNTPSPPSQEHQLANIRITKANTAVIEALQKTVDNPVEVVKALEKKTKSLSKKKYLKFDLSKDVEHKNEIEDLIQKASTVPDIISGPVQAEKKRSEILNAIKLGKRPRDEKFETELPKNKHMNTKEDGLLKCTYCSTRHTTMWRSGPDGQGTLCNSCGIQWKRGEILVDAPVISKEEELRLILERKERAKAAEIIEIEKSDRETKKQQRKVDRQHSQNPGRENAPPIERKNSSASPNQTIPTNATTNDNKVDSTASDNKKKKLDNSDAKPKKPQPTKSKKDQQPETQQHAPAPKTQEPAKPVPLSLYNAAGIPLPTLSIDFAGSMQFYHPNCGITLLDRHFSLRLCKDGCEQTTINFDKADLTDAQFEVVSEGVLPLQREVLRMKIAPQSKTISAFNQTFTVDKTHTIHVRFLEKLDPSGGAVVQRILQRWLVTVPQQSSS